MTGTVSDRWGETVAVAPFAAWLVEQEKRVGSREELADLLGLNPRRIYEYMSGRQKRISTDVVDRTCCAVGVHIADLYPELYSDLDEEAAFERAVAAYEATAGRCSRQAMRDAVRALEGSTS